MPIPRLVSVVIEIQGVAWRRVLRLFWGEPPTDPPANSHAKGDKRIGF